MNDFNNMHDDDNVFGEVISSYTRAEALSDGVLHEVPEKIIKKVGFRFPIAITNTLMHLHIALVEFESLPEVERSAKIEKGFEGLLYALKTAISGCEGNICFFPFTKRVEKVEDRFEIERVNLRAVVSPGDNLEPVITIMMEFED